MKNIKIRRKFNTDALDSVIEYERPAMQSNRIKPKSGMAENVIAFLGI